MKKFKLKGPSFKDKLAKERAKKPFMFTATFTTGTKEDLYLNLIENEMLKHFKQSGVEKSIEQAFLGLCYGTSVVKIADNAECGISFTSMPLGEMYGRKP